jgi:hypothetical protein
MLTGGCFCGAIRYEITAPAQDATICHCVDCRRAAGAPIVAWFTVARDALRIVRGEPAGYASNPAVLRQFCSTCGTQLTWRHDGSPDHVDVSTGSLDAPEQVPPLDHTWTSQRLAWLRINDELPQYPGAEAPDNGADPAAPD